MLEKPPFASNLKGFYRIVCFLMVTGAGMPTHPNAILRLEVEAENERAVNVYHKCGFEVIPYMEMKK